MAKKVVVIGLDGGTFTLLKPLVAEGLMPNFKRLLEEGAAGILESTMPPMTGTAWTTFATGKHPSKHGVYDFLLVEDSLENFHVSTSRDIKGKTVYEIIAEHGLTPVIINLPNSWPPRLDPQKYITITDLLTQGEQWIYPASLKEQFPELEKYKLTPNESVRAANRRQQYAREIIQLEHDHLAAVKRIFQEKPWDFFFYLFSATDWIQHPNFHELMAGNAFPEAYEVYQVVDNYLGWFMTNLPPESDLLVMSDHGFKTFHKMFYFNKWLAKGGYIQTKIGTQGWTKEVTRRAKEIKKKQRRWVLPPLLFKILEYFPFLQPFLLFIYRHIFKKIFKVRAMANLSIDYAKTTVCFPKGTYMTNAYLNDSRKYKNGTIKSEEEYQKIRQQVIEKIKALKDPAGNPVVLDVYTKEQVYGPHAPQRAPDLFFELGDYWLNGQFHSGSLFVDNFINNKHEKNGIFLAWGSDIKKGELPQHSIADLCPTILTMLGLPLPLDLDGQVISEIFRQKPTIKYQLEKEELKGIIEGIEL